jgi:exosortase
MAPSTLQRPVKAPFGYTKVVVFGILILLCYAPAIRSLVDDWMVNEDMGHGFFVPLVAGYLLWQQRDELKALPPGTSWWGLGLVLLGAAQSIVATLGVELFLARSAIILTLTGSVWMLGGTATLKKTAFPLFLLCFMVPLPAVIFNAITFPLQILASQLAEGFLRVVGIPVLRQGNVLELPSGPLSVVEACSGIRSLLSLSFLALVYGRFLEKSAVMRAVLFVATIPIAILANAGRVTITGVLSEVKPELAKGFFHDSTGWVIFMLALGILLVFHRVALRCAGLWRRRTEA